MTWPAAPTYVLAISFPGLLWVCLVRGKARWLGVLAAASIVWWPRVTPPDIWIDSEGGNAAVRTQAGAYALRSKVRQYGFQQWTNHYALPVLGDADRLKDYDCRDFSCVPRATGQQKVGFWFSNKPPNDARMLELCHASELVILRSPIGQWPAICGHVQHISSADFDRLGAMELRRRGKVWLIEGAQPLRGHRYWSTPSSQEDGETFQ